MSGSLNLLEIDTFNAYRRNFVHIILNNTNGLPDCTGLEFMNYFGKMQKNVHAYFWGMYDVGCSDKATVNFRWRSVL